MSEALVKTFKWMVSVAFFIFGIYCLRIVTDDGDIKPLMLVVISFGMVYWLSKATYEASKKVFLTGFSIMMALGFLTHIFLWDLVAMFIPGIGFYMAWALLTLIIGAPAMVRAYMND
jgi:hypothetical protein